MGKPAVAARYREEDQRPKEAAMKDQVRGKAEELKGKAMGNPGQELKGKVRQTVGKVTSAARDIRAEVHEEAERRRERDLEDGQAGSR
jgi:uncharacterized protein YjbJ (UPF0337 family)